MTPGPRLSQLIVLSAVSLLVLTSGATAHAHDFEPERELMVQVFDDHVDIMIAYREAPGVRTDFFLAQFGFDVDGDGSELVDALAGRALLPRILDGLEFEIEGERPETSQPEVKIEDDDGPLRAAAFVRYDLDELDDGDERTMIVRSADRSLLSTPTLVYPGGDLKLADDQEADGEHPEAVRFELHRDDEYRITFRRSP